MVEPINKTGPLPTKTQTQAWQPQGQSALNIDPGRDRLEQERLERERVNRQEQHSVERRRRKGGNINRMAQFRLDFIPPEMLDLDNYVYRWANDESNRILMLTQHDDYDKVRIDELKGMSADVFDSEGGGVVRMLVGTQNNGQPMYAYLLKKRRSFWEADNEEMVMAREDMMAGRIYRGELDEHDKMVDPNFNSDNYYATKGNQIGGASDRRKGPIAKRTIR